MKPMIHQAFRVGFVALGLPLLVSCGDGDKVTEPGGTPHFDAGAGFNGVVTSIAPARDNSGDMYVGGGFTQYDGATAIGMARLNRNGSLDTGFDVGTGFDDIVMDVEPIDDGTGDVYVGGRFVAFRGDRRQHIIRLKADGTEGAADYGGGFTNDVETLALNDGRGDLYAGGLFITFNGTSRELVARLDPDGSLDMGFATGTGFDDDVVNRVLVLAVDGTGRIYAGGLFNTFRGNSRSCVVRINPDGSNDGSFDPGTGFDFFVRDLAFANDGSGAVYAAGSFRSFRGNSRNRVARMTPDGSNDGAFVTGAGFDADAYVVAVANDGSGDVYVGGSFTSYDGTPAMGIARLNSDGSLDAGFDTGAGFVGTIFALAVATDGSGDVMVGGAFTSYQGTPVGRIVRLNSNGSLD